MQMNFLDMKLWKNKEECFTVVAFGAGTVVICDTVILEKAVKLWVQDMN